jgi:hypothetical protein
MARTRLELHEELCNILGSRNVYFRPPSKGLKYPCIIYDIDGEKYFPADNKSYIGRKRWSVTIVDEDPDSEIGDRMKEALPYCTFDRPYTSDDLNHFVYTIYY